MKKKLLCLMLAALMLTSVCAFAEGEIEQPTAPNPLRKRKRLRRQNQRQHRSPKRSRNSRR